MANLFNLSQSTKTSIPTDPKVKKQPLFDLSSNTKITPSVKSVTGNQKITDYSKPETIYLETPEERASAKSNIQQKPSVFNKRKILSRVGNFLLKTNPMTAPIADVQALNKSLDPVMQPIIDMTLNTKVGKDVAMATKYARGSSAKAVPEALYKVIGDKINPAVDDKKFTEYYNESVNRWKTRGEDPNVTFPEQVARGVVDSGVQSGVGVLLNFVPLIGKPLSATYFGLVSASEQIENEGEVTSGSKILVDTWGDTMISNTVEGMFKKSIKDLTKVGFVETAKKFIGNLGKGFATEGITEPTQTFGKFAIDYQKAKSPEQRSVIIEKAKEYIKNGGMLMEFLVGGLSGAGITGLASIAQQSQVNPNIPKPKLGLTEDDDKEFTPEQNQIRESFREDIKDNLAETGMNKPYVARQLSKETGIDNAITTLMVDEVAETITPTEAPEIDNETIIKQALNEAGSTLEETKTPEAVTEQPKLKISKEEPLIIEAKKYKSAEEFVQRQISQETGFKDSHVAPSFDDTPVAERMDSGGDFSLSEVVKGQHNQPDDYFDPKVGARYYMYDNPAGQESYNAIRKIMDGKSKTLTAYRTVGKDVKVNSLENGEWITFSEKYAKQHGIHRFDGKYKIIKQEVNPNEVWWDGNDINEWGYDNGTGGGRKTQLSREKELTDIWNKAQGEAKMKVKGETKKVTDQIDEHIKEKIGNVVKLAYDYKNKKGSPDLEAIQMAEDLEKLAKKSGPLSSEDRANFNELVKRINQEDYLPSNALDTLTTKEDNKTYGTTRSTKNGERNNGEVQPNRTGVSRGGIWSEAIDSMAKRYPSFGFRKNEDNVEYASITIRRGEEESKVREVLEWLFPEAEPEVIDRITEINYKLEEPLVVHRTNLVDGRSGFTAAIRSLFEGKHNIYLKSDIIPELTNKDIWHEGPGHKGFEYLGEEGRIIRSEEIKKQYELTPELFNDFIKQDAKAYWDMSVDFIKYYIKNANPGILDEVTAYEILNEVGLTDENGTAIIPENVMEASFNFEETNKKIDKALTDRKFKTTKKTQPQNLLMIDEINSYMAESPEVFKDSEVEGIAKFATDILDGTYQFKEIEVNLKPKSESGPEFGGVTFKLKDSTKLTSSDIIKKHANIQLKRDIVITDVYGEKATLKAGEGITPYEVTGNKFILQDGEAYLVSKSQAQNVINNSKTGEAKPFAPELKQTEETIKGGDKATDKDIIWKQISKDGEPKNLSGTLGDREFVIKDEGDGFYVAEIDGVLGRKTRNYTDAVEELNRYLAKDTPITKYSQYTLPGGENYKEILIKAPTGSNITIKKESNNDYTVFKNGKPIFTGSETDAKAYESLIDNTSFKSSHWDEPNVISHIRMNERTYNGKKVAFMEELQSDWAREGRDKGFKDSIQKKPTLQQEYNEIADKVQAYIDRGEKTRIPAELLREQNSDKYKGLKYTNDKFIDDGKIPNNPLLKNWQELSIKRALQEAVNSNAKYFAWINGPQTAARYNLSKEVDGITWKTTDGLGTKSITIVPKNGSDITVLTNKDGDIKTAGGNIPSAWMDKNISEVIGKGLGERIVKEEKGMMKGEGLNMGGEWATNLYDRQVRTIVENLTGQKVEMLDMGLQSGKNTKQWASEEWGTALTYKRMETEGIGLQIRPMEGGEVYVVTDLLGDGKFKALSRNKYYSEIAEPNQKYGELKTHFEKRTDIKTDEFKESFDISESKSAGQMGIELTPEVKQIINGEAPQVKVSGKLPFTEQITAPVMFKIKLPEVRAELTETQRQLDEAVAYPEIYGQELIVELTSKVADLRNQVMQEKYPTFETGNVIEDLRKTLDYTESRVGLAKKMSVEINNNIAEAVQQEEDIPKEEKEKTATKAEVLNLYNNSLTEPLLELPDDIKKLQEEFAGKMEALEYKRDKLASHPGRILSKFISRKEGQFLDFKNPDQAKTKSEKEAITKRNKKIMAASQGAFEGTQYTELFDDPDTIRGQIDEYNNIKKEIDVADNEIKQLATRYFNRTNEFYGQETDNLNVMRSFNEFELGLEIEASGEINTGIDNYIYDDIADRAKNSSFQVLGNTKYYSRDFFRIMKRFFANSYPLMQQMFITPFENAKGANAKQEIELKNELYEDIVKKFGIKLGSAESRAVMDYGERNLQEEFAPANPETETTLKAKFGVEKTQKIIAADQWFHDKYTKLVDEINVVYKDVYGAIWQKKKNLDSEINLLEENIKEQKIKMSQTPNKNTLKYLSYIRALRRLYGMKQQRIDLTNSEAWWRGKIIPKRNDYYRHYQEVAEGFGALKNIITQESNIPTNLAAISQQTKPKSKFLQFGQKRIGNKSKRDAVGAFLDYVPAATYAIHMTPHIERFRKITEAITRSDNKIYSPFITYLTKFTNELTGKTALFDRDLQEVTGRKLFRIVDWLNKRVKANVIMGNPRVTLVQLASLPPGIASAKQYIVPGVKRFIIDMNKPNSPMKKSNFLTERYKDMVDEKFRTGVINSPRKFARMFMRALEKPSVEIIWNSHYEQGVSKNVPNPMSYADSKTRNVVAGRGIGEVPLIYNSKAMQLIAPFQLEVGNLWILMGEWKKEKDLSAFAILFILSWLFNRGMEDITGSDVLPDPIQASMEGIKTFIDEENKLKGAGLLTGRLGGEVLSNIPFGQYAASLYPEYGLSWLGGIPRAELFGKGDPLKYGSGLLSFSGLKDPLFKILPPFGGSQLKKTYEGIDAYLDGKVANKGGDEIYSIPKGEMKLLQMSLFGKYSVKEAKDYFNREEVSDKTYKDKLKEWDSGIPKTQENLDDFEKEMVQEIYGAKYSTRELTEVSKKFAFYRSFGEKNKLANQIMEASDNEERVDILIKTREELGKEEFVKFFNQGRKTVKSATGSDVPILISDNLKEFYLLKTYLNKKLKDSKISQDKYDTYLEYYKGGRTTFEKIKEKLD